MDLYKFGVPSLYTKNDLNMISNIVSMTDTDFINMDGYSYVVKSFSLQYQKGLRIIKDY